MGPKAFPAAVGSPPEGEETKLVSTVCPHAVRRRPLLCFTLAAVVLLPSLWPRVYAQETEPVLVEEVRIEGVSEQESDSLRGLLETRVGSPYDGEVVQGDLRALRRIDRFDNAVVEILDEGRVVVFSVARRPRIEAVRIEGNEEFGDSDLLALVPGPDTALDRFAIDRGLAEIEDKYQDAGYYFVEVTIDEQLLTDEGTLVYRVIEGPRVRVREIEFEGNTAFSDGRLRRLIQTNTYIWIFRAGAFDEDTADRDAVEIERFYRNEGYLDARAGYRFDFEDIEQTRLRLTFVIEEGPRYFIDEVELEGNAVFSDSQVRDVLRLGPGEPFRDEILQADVRRIQDLYGEIGYIDVRVDASFAYVEAPELVRVTFEIREGDRAKIGRITIRGNQETQDKVIRRELQFFPGEDFNLLKVRRAERRLRETALFSQATVTPLPGDEPGVREALVEVEEADAVLLLLGVGVSTDSGVLGSISLQNRNFDLFDWPRSFGEFFRGRSFRGAGQQFRIQAEPGTELSRFRIDFVEPWLLDRPLRFGTSLYLWERGRDSYDEGRFGGTVSLGRRFESGPLDGWAVEGALRLEAVDIDDVNFFAGRDIRRVDGSHFLTSVKGTIVRDTTDSRWRPSEGYRATFAWEQVGALGGDFNFGKPTASIAKYFTVSTDQLERKSILALKGDIGFIVGDAPVFERFYAGGFGSMRGFEFRGISPRQGLRDDAVGGDFILLAGAEYSFPLYGENLRGVTFLDMGTVEEGFEITGWRAAIGFGLRIYADFFGPVPIVLDFGIPIIDEEDDETQIFNFSIGAAF